MQPNQQNQGPGKFLEQKYDKRLDKLYTSSVKCPYCKNKIQRLQTVCSRCGLHKIQIAYASNKRAKEMMGSEAGKIVKMRRCPNDVKLSQMGWRLVLGIFGVHNFYTGRKIRGWIMLGCMLIFVLQAIVFPFGKVIQNDGGLEYVGMHPWRLACIDWGAPFPLDFFGAIALILWLSDIFGVILGWYKYPVRLGEVNDAGKIWTK